MTEKPVNLDLYYEVQELVRPQANKPEPDELFFCPKFPVFPDRPYDEVFPKLYIGSSKIVTSEKGLKSIGTTHIVNCSMGPNFNQVNTTKEFYEPFKIEFHGIPAIDQPTFKLLPYLKDAAAFIEKSLNSGGIVYVHCQQGVSRSATVVLAFLMLYKDMDLPTAVKQVRAKRPVTPNAGFLRELCELQDEIDSSKPQPADD